MKQATQAIRNHQKAYYQGTWPVQQMKNNTREDGPYQEEASTIIAQKGQAKIQFPNGDCYIGQVKDGRMHGFGTFVGVDGSKY
jgi:hypothetical protein